MYETIKIGNKYGWYMHDDQGNTTKEGKELFATQDEAQAFIDKMGGKSENTVEVLSDPSYQIIKVGNKFGYYQQDAQGNTLMEGSEFFARHSEAQEFINKKFPVNGESVDESKNGGKVADTTTKATDTTAGVNAGATAGATQKNYKVLGDVVTVAGMEMKKGAIFDLTTGNVQFPYTFVEADLVALPVLTDNGVIAGDIVDTVENLNLALTPKA